MCIKLNYYEVCSKRENDDDGYYSHKCVVSTYYLHANFKELECRRWF